MRVCHLLTSASTEHDLVTVARLQTGLCSHHVDQTVAASDGNALARARDLIGANVRRVHLRMRGLVGSAGPSGFEAYRPHLVHIWGFDAAALRSLAGTRDIAVALTTQAVGDLIRGRDRYVDETLRRTTILCETNVARNAIARAGVSAAKIDVVPPGVPLAPPPEVDAPTRASLGLPDDQPVLLTPGPPRRDESQYRVVWATALLQQLMPDIRLIVPGDSPERLRLQRFAESFQLPELICCTGDRWRFDQLVRLADVVVTGRPTSLSVMPLFRAMTAGVPVVAGDTVLAKECLRDGETALLAPRDIPTRLAGAVLRAIEDQDLRERLTSAAREHVATTYPLERFFHRLESVYEQAFGRIRTLVLGR